MQNEERQITFNDIPEVLSEILKRFDLLDRDRCAGGTRGRRSHPVGRHCERHRRDHRPQDRHHFL